MNWVDIILLVLLLASVIIGSKKGLIRELMAFVIFFTAIIFSVNYIDKFAVWVYDKLGGSPLISAFLSFVILLALSYAAFKLLGIVFYKVAQIKQTGKKDQMGGALVGFLRGWVAIGFLTFVAFLLPLPDAFYTSFESSFFGPAVAKTIPLMYEGTSKIHPNNPNFMDQIEKTLLDTPTNTTSGRQMLDEERVEIHKVLYQIEKYFSSTQVNGA
ncbi:MAG: CvpA family protein [Calditrichaeota bacterium]|nr:MAG: CvpA family protein [Calditrichota bacterium]